MSARKSRTPYSIPTVVATTVLLLIMAGPLISACDSAGSNGNGGNASDGLIPLSEGNQWTAEVTGGRSGTLTAEVESEGTIKLTLNDMSGTVEVSEQSGGGLILESFGGSLENQDDVMRFKYPADEGDTYEYTDGDGTTYEVTVSKTSASVPAGDYENCLKYEFRNVEYEDVDSVAIIKPGLGPIRFGGKDSEAITYKLTSTNVDG